MVEIHEQDIDNNDKPSPKKHYNIAPSSSSSPLSFDHPQKSNISPLPPQTNSPNSSPSSISSDHTFHGFSPIKENIPSLSPSTPPPHSLSLTPSPQIQTLVPLHHGTNNLIREQPEVVTKTEPDAETGFADQGFDREQNRQERRRERRRRAAVGGGREKVVKRMGLGLRFCEFVFCLVSFSVMAADKNRGWALDSFDRYVEFRYAMTVNIIGFAYSGLQGLDLLHQLTTGKDPNATQIRYSFDFGIDQILAYLLLSASSSAFTRVDDWISNWGNDKFPAMASASVGVSFVAFVSFAFSSLISGFLLCTH